MVARLVRLPGPLDAGGDDERKNGSKLITACDTLQRRLAPTATAAGKPIIAAETNDNEFFIPLKSSWIFFATFQSVGDSTKRT